jgi:hypothetical protein
MESLIETKAIAILQFIQGLRGALHVTLEEGTWAAWLYDLLKPHVTKLVVCDPRKNALLKEGNKSDKIDARKLADLLVAGQCSIGGPGVPSDQCCTTTMKVVSRACGSFAAITGEPGRFAPQLFATSPAA